MGSDARTEPFLALASALKPCPFFSLAAPEAAGLGAGPDGRWMAGPNRDLYQLDRCITTDASRPVYVSVEQLRKGDMVLFLNYPRWWAADL